MPPTCGAGATCASALARQAIGDLIKGRSWQLCLTLLNWTTTDLVFAPRHQRTPMGGGHRRGPSWARTCSACAKPMIAVPKKIGFHILGIPTNAPSNHQGRQAVTWALGLLGRGHLGGANGRFAKMIRIHALGSPPWRHRTRRGGAPSRLPPRACMAAVPPPAPGPRCRGSIKTERVKL